MSDGSNRGGHWQQRGENKWRPYGRGRGGGGGWKGNDNQGGYKGGYQQRDNDGGWGNYGGNQNYGNRDGGGYQGYRGNNRGNYGGNQNNFNAGGYRGGRGRGQGFQGGRGGGGGNKNHGPIDSSKCFIPAMLNNPWQKLEKAYEEEYGVTITEKMEPFTKPVTTPSDSS